MDLFRVYPTPSNVDGAWGYAPYRGIVGAGVRRGKYRPDPVALSELGRCVGGAAKSHFGDFDVVVPVPQSVSSTISRGFSPVGILATRIAKEVGLPCQDLLRCKGGTPQVLLSRSERKSNIRGRVSAVKPLVSRNILIVDDVVTTGATAAECGRALRCAGADTVSLLSVTVASIN